MELQAEDPRSQFEVIADDIRGQIVSGALPVGHRLPSIRALKEQYRVSPQTIQNAIRVLRGDGLVHSVAGKGVYISEPAVADVEADADLPTPKYVRIMDQLDKLAAEMVRIDARLSDLESERAARAGSARPAAGSKSRPT